MSVIDDFSILALVALVVAAVLIGVAKTAISGIGSLSVALFAAVLPARESTGAILPLLIVGDVIGVAMYRNHADWPRLARILPTVAAGVLLGVWFVAIADDTVMRRTIGVILLALVAVHLWSRRRDARAQVLVDGESEQAEGSAQTEGPPTISRSRVAAAIYGGLTGFTTMVANAAGPVMSLYLLAARLEMKTFLGTVAWVFALVNLFKLPFSIGLGLITRESLILNAALVPAVLIGALIGRWIIQRIDQRLFERLVLAFTVLAGLNLVR